MENFEADDQTLSDLLTQARVIAVVGHSDRRDRPSYQIAQFLHSVGYQVYPVNPTVTMIDGAPCYPSLRDVPAAIDLVNVFRRSEYLAEVVDEAIAIGAKAIWAQLGIADPNAAATAEAAGLAIVMNACIKVEYLRLEIQRDHA